LQKGDIVYVKLPPGTPRMPPKSRPTQLKEKRSRPKKSKKVDSTGKEVYGLECCGRRGQEGDLVEGCLGGRGKREESLPKKPRGGILW